MNRRKFFKGCFSVAAATVVAPLLPEPKPKPTVQAVNLINAGSGYVSDSSKAKCTYTYQNMPMTYEEYTRVFHNEVDHLIQRAK